MELICKACGKEFYLSEQDPVPEIEDLCCDECDGDLDYLIELTEDDLCGDAAVIETGTVVDYENEDLDDDDDDPEDSYIDADEEDAKDYKADGDY